MQAVDFILDTTFDDLPDATIHEAIRCLVDTLGVGIGASKVRCQKLPATMLPANLVDQVPPFGRMVAP